MVTPSDPVVGDLVEIGVWLENPSQVPINNITILAEVDGTVLNEFFFYHIPPSANISTQFQWEAESDEHNITLKIFDSRGIIHAEEQVNIGVNHPIWDLSGVGAVYLSLIVSFILLLIVLVLMLLLKRQKHRKALANLKERVEYQKSRGVGVHFIEEKMSLINRK